MSTTHHLRWPLAGLCALALAACGGDSGEDSAPAPEQQQQQQQQQQQTTDPGPVTMPREALKTIEEQAALAADSVGGVSEDQLVPSEDGAQLVLERGALDEQEFCAAEERVMEAEAGPEAATAFERGWERGGGDASTGAAIYQALSFGCL